MNTNGFFSRMRRYPVFLTSAVLIQSVGFAGGVQAQSKPPVARPAHPPAVIVDVPPVTVQVPEIHIPDLDTLARIDAEVSAVRPAIAASIDARSEAELAAQLMAQAGPLPRGRLGSVWIGGRESGSYDAGLAALDNDEWQQAIDIFDRVIKAGRSRVDGAMYWKAYALDKLGQRKEAVATLQELEKAYPNSRWLNDAQALEMEVKQNSGQAVKPEDHGNEELKLLAINSLMQSDPQRAIPMLQQVLKGRYSPKVKERALFVLAQNSSPAAREVLGQVAAGSNGNPDLQMKAVRYLGIYGRTNTQMLRDVYVGSKDPDVKREVLRSLGMARDVDQLLNIAKNETSPDLRAEAIRQLGMMRADDQLLELYRVERAGDIKAEIIRSMAMSGNADRLGELARQESDAKARADAVRSLGTMDNKKTADTLVQIYKTDKDEGVKKAVINALFMQRNAKALVDLARAENNVTLKKEIVSRLSMMRSKEATDYMLELLK